MKKLKILIVTPTFFPKVSGNSVCARRIEIGLKKLGHEVLIRVPKQIDENEIVKFNPDVIHGLHGYKCRIVQVLSSKLNVPYIITLTGSDYEECLIDSVNFERGLEQSDAKTITLNVMKNASFLVVYNNKTSDRIVEQFPQFQSKMRVIKKGLPITGEEDYHFRELNNIKNTDFVFSLVSGIRVRKNNFCPIEPLKKLHKQYPNIVLTFVGPVAEEQYALELKEKVKELDWAKFVGVVPVEQMKQVYLESDVILNCSHYEGESNAIIEAMYYGKPLIISKTPGNIPLINDREDGLFFDVKNSDDFYKMAEELINNKELRDKISKNAKTKSLDLLNVNESKDYEKLYFLSIGE